MSSSDDAFDGCTLFLTITKSSFPTLSLLPGSLTNGTPSARLPPPNASKSARFPLRSASPSSPTCSARRPRPEPVAGSPRRFRALWRCPDTRTYWIWSRTPDRIPERTPLMPSIRPRTAKSGRRWPKTTKSGQRWPKAVKILSIPRIVIREDTTNPPRMEESTSPFHCQPVYNVSIICARR